MAVRDWLYVTAVAFFASLGGYLTGYSIGSVNGLQNFIGFLEYFDLGNSSTNSSCTETSNLMEDDRLILGAIISSVYTGGALGNLFAGKPADYFGRKVSLLMSGVLVVLGASLQSSATQGAPWMLILGRIIAGVGYGTFYMAGPLYIAEIAPKHIRGSLTSLIGPTIAMGIMTGYVTNILLYDKPYGWRVSRLLACVFACVYIVGMSFMPRTPRWLMLKGRESEARDVLRKTLSKRGQEAIEEELDDIRRLDTTSNRSFCEELKLMLKWKNLKRFLLGVPLHIYAPLCGDSVYFYSELLFCSLGILPFVTALLIGGLTLCGTTFTTIFIDKLGRKPMMLGGGLVMSLLTGAAATLVYVFNLEEVDNQIVGYIVVCLVCLFMLVYSSTWYVIPWVVTSEIYPLEGRALAVAMSTAFNWTIGYLFLQAFPSLLTFFHTFGVLFMISLINLTAGWFYLFVLPETKGVSLEEMEKLFSKPWLERVGLACCFRCQCCQPAVKRESEASSGTNSTDGQENEAANEEPAVKRECEASSRTDSIDIQDEVTNVERDEPESIAKETDKDWEEYWEQYEVELGDLGKETTV